MKSNQRKKFITTTGLVWAGCGIILFFLYMLLVSPQVQAKRDLAARVAEQERAYAKALRAADEQNQQRLKEQLASLRQRQKDFIIDSGGAGDLTFDVSRIAKTLALESFSITSQKAQLASKGKRLKHIEQSYFEISFRSGFRQLAAFINALERHKPILFVETFSITRPREKGIKNEVQLSLAALVARKQEEK